MSTPTRQVSTELPGPRARAIIERGSFDMQNLYRSVIFDEERSQGTRLVDVDGNCFLDLFSSFALGALGYNHPSLLAVARSDAFARAAVQPTSTPFLTSEVWIRFIEQVERRFAPKHMARMFCLDSGSEGVEHALKVAFIHHGEARRRRDGQSANPLELPADEQARILEGVESTDAVVVSFAGAFHGRGLGPLSATHSKVIHKADLPSFRWPMVPFPANRWPLEQHAEENARLEADSIAALERVMEAYRGRVAAILVEPLQCEGGDRHASPQFFQAVQRIALEHGASLVLDEVQTGVAISGTMWLHEQLGVQPDLMPFGKKLQMGGFFATAERDIRQFGRMYQTRNGDRTRALIAGAVLSECEALLPQIRDVGAYFLARLVELGGRFPALVSEPRGRGFLISFDMPTVAARDDFLRRALRQGVFATYTGARSVRLRPHLITTRAEVDEAMDVFFAVCKEMA